MAERNSLRVNRPSVVDETIDGEALIVNLGTGVYYSIAGTGEVIWRMLAEGLTPAAVASNLHQLFDVAPQDASNAVAVFVDQLIAEELLVSVIDAGPSGATSFSGAGPGDSAPGPFVLPELKRYADMQDLLLLDPVHDVDEKGWPNARSAPLLGTERRD